VLWVHALELTHNTKLFVEMLTDSVRFNATGKSFLVWRNLARCKQFLTDFWRAAACFEDCIVDVWVLGDYLYAVTCAAIPFAAVAPL